MNVLLSFIGSNDPYSIKPNDSGQSIPGPILSIIKDYKKKFSAAHFFYTASMTENMQSLHEHLDKYHPEVFVNYKKLLITDPTDYKQILMKMRGEISVIREKHFTDDLFISVSSGTPEMHASWLFLHGAGELPSRILHSRPKQFVSAHSPQFEEYDFSEDYFPEIRFSYIRSMTKKKLSIENLLPEIGLIGHHPKFRQTIIMAEKLAMTEYPVLLLGESGTGKELFAKLIHKASGKKGPFTPVNLAAITPDLLAAELFGYKKGAFTGAAQDYAGKLRDSEGGSVFLDEIGEMPYNAQSSLLRFLNNREILSIGSSKANIVNVRVIAATNRNLEQAIAAKEFREDIYYRFESGIIWIPALRERRTDIPIIAQSIVDHYNKQNIVSRRLSQSAINFLEEQEWPGNIRQLIAVILRSLIFSENEILKDKDIADYNSANLETTKAAIPSPISIGDGFHLPTYMHEMRVKIIDQAMQLASGKQKKAAELLGISSAALSKELSSR